MTYSILRLQGKSMRSEADCLFDEQQEPVPPTPGGEGGDLERTAAGEVVQDQQRTGGGRGRGQ